MSDNILIRPYQPTDSIPEITALLHRAYAKPAGQGVRFWASRQDDTVTERRLKKGTSFLAIKDGAIVGTISVYGPDKNSAAEFYRREDVRYFGQFGVDPALQGTGLGKRLYQTVEDHCRANNVKFLALDTCESAADLIEMYRRWGFKQVDRVKWEVVDFRSIIMAKELTAPSIPLPEGGGSKHPFPCGEEPALSKAKEDCERKWAGVRSVPPRSE
ncbi:MAG: GNAT family N-acetyltransferase [Deltaproteobacteria bacterium]|nr:GNAT family N-acetyltransferase [Deltaproteobacteria bacterium]